MQALVAEDHLRAALFATAQQHAKDTLIDDDHRQASLKATTKQYEMEAAAAAHGMYVDQYLRNVNQFPTMVCYIGPKPGLAQNSSATHMFEPRLGQERTELDHTLAAWKATANERDIEAKASAMGMWPDQYLVYTKAI